MALKHHGHEAPRPRGTTARGAPPPAGLHRRGGAMAAGSRQQSFLHVTVSNSFSTMAEITPTMSLIVEMHNMSENSTQSSTFHQMGALRKLVLLCCVVCAITPTAERLSKQLVLHCVYSHTHVALTWS